MSPHLVNGAAASRPFRVEQHRRHLAPERPAREPRHQTAELMSGRRNFLTRSFPKVLLRSSFSWVSAWFSGLETEQCPSRRRGATEHPTHCGGNGHTSGRTATKPQRGQRNPAWRRKTPPTPPATTPRQRQHRGPPGFRTQNQRIKVEFWVSPVVADRRWVSPDQQICRRPSLSGAGCRTVWWVNPWVDEPWDGPSDSKIRCSTPLRAASLAPFRWCGCRYRDWAGTRLKEPDDRAQRTHPGLSRC